MFGYYLLLLIQLILIPLLFLDLSSASAVSSVCSSMDNPCMADMDRTELNFLYGISKDQLTRACDMYVKSMHCLDFHLASCTEAERESVRSFYLHLRISMDRICHDYATHTSYLAYAGCLQKAYPRTDQCMYHFTSVMENATRKLDQGDEQQTESTALGPPWRDPAHRLHEICHGLHHLILCIHNAVTCEETSHRDIKEILTLMIRGGVPSEMYTRCTKSSVGGTSSIRMRSSSSATMSPAKQVTYLQPIVVVCTVVFFSGRLVKLN